MSGWEAVAAVTDGAMRREAELTAELHALRAAVSRVASMADEIERGEWGDHWRDINVHGAIRRHMGAP